MITEVMGHRQGASGLSDCEKWDIRLTGKRTKYHKVTGWIDPEFVHVLSRDPGAYGLLIRLPCQFRGNIGALGRVTLPPGSYLYLGSANGPGGLPARLRHHLRADKRPHWHVDHLNSAGTVERVFIVPDGQECDLVDFALELPSVHVPVLGFGSSDCRLCAAHLLGLPQDSETVLEAFSSPLNFTRSRRGLAGIPHRP